MDSASDFPWVPSPPRLTTAQGIRQTEIHGRETGRSSIRQITRARAQGPARRRAAHAQGTRRFRAAERRFRLRVHRGRQPPGDPHGHDEKHRQRAGEGRCWAGKPSGSPSRSRGTSWTHYRQVRRVSVATWERCWERLSVDGAPHPHSFTQARAARPAVRVAADVGGRVRRAVGGGGFADPQIDGFQLQGLSQG